MGITSFSTATSISGTTQRTRFSPIRVIVAAPFSREPSRSLTSWPPFRSAPDYACPPRKTLALARFGVLSWPLSLSAGRGYSHDSTVIRYRGARDRLPDREADRDPRPVSPHTQRADRRLQSEEQSRPAARARRARRAGRARSADPPRPGARRSEER